MALVLQNGETWVDPFGTTHDIAMACPYEITGSGCKNYEIINVGIWLNLASRDAGNKPWKTFHYKVEGAEYATYFAKAVLNQLNVNPYSQAGQWLLNCSGDFNVWEVDE